ncbi:MAG: alpha/beta fold hydrolase [Candidatus Gastranaerophilales bacterium]|nr:alpha/beta fold hydrolase [Candidatus Gastranaerophilales bacterium]
MKFTFKKVILFTLFLISVFYIYVYAFDVEKKSVYHPEKAYLPPELYLLDKFTANSQRIDDDTVLSYWYIRGEKDKPTILYTEGTFRNMSYFQEKIKFLVQNNYPVILYDYRGYGQSTNKPSEEGIYSDLDKFIEHICSDYNITENDIIIWGHSLGGAVATEAATKHKFKGVIIEAAFTSMDDMKKYGAKLLSNNPFQYVLNRVVFTLVPVTQKFDNLAKIDKINSSTLILHSKPDSFIPYEMSIELNKKNPATKLYISEKGEHEDPYWHNQEILKFIKTLK